MPNQYQCLYFVVPLQLLLFKVQGDLIIVGPNFGTSSVREINGPKYDNELDQIKGTAQLHHGTSRGLGLILYEVWDE